MTPRPHATSPYSAHSFDDLMTDVMAAAGRFGHREHVHLTWLAVRRFGVPAAVSLVSDGIQRTARYAGAPQKYHATVSRAWVELVGYHAAEHADDDFAAFAEHNPALLDKRLLTRFYHPATLASPGARTGWAEPDRAPFPGATPTGGSQPRKKDPAAPPSNPSKTRAIAEAKVKTDKVDARILAQLLAADFPPPVWLPDERTRRLRRQVGRRAQTVRQRTRLRNQVHAILARNLSPTPPVSDLFGVAGRRWLSRQELPPDERSAVQALLRQLDFHCAELAAVDRELAVEALADPVVARLMTIPSVDAIAAISIVAAVGDFSRFDDPDKLVAYVGLNPRVRQSGNSAPVHGRNSKAGRAQVRGVLVEAAWSASRAPGPLRAFYQRIQARRGFQTAVVATARKMTVLAWHLAVKDQDYAFARPALVSHKRRKLELAAGAPSRRGNYRQPGAADNDLLATGFTVAAPLGISAARATC